MRRTTKPNSLYPREPPDVERCVLCAAYCRIATAFGNTSLRYAHNVRETFRNARLERAQGANREPFCNGALGRRAAAWAYWKTPHFPSIRNCDDAGILSTGEMFGPAFGATAASETLCALRRSHWKSQEPCDVRTPRTPHCRIFRKTSALVRALLSLQYNGDNCDF